MKNIPENIKVIFNSVAPLTITVILFVLVGNFGISKISDIRTQIDSARIAQNVLTQKVSTLQSLGGTIATYSSAASVALPDSNTSLAVISQLRNLSAANTLLISNIKTASEAKDPSGLSRVDISFDVDGGLAQITTFLKAVGTIAPIANISQIKINESNGTVKASVSARSYWSALPATLPTTTQALDNLTPDEQAVLTTVNSLTQPTFGAVAPASGGAVKSNPFQ